MRRVLIVGLLLLAAGAGAVVVLTQPPENADFATLDDPGRLEMEGPPLVAGAPGELLLRYHVGAGGLPRGWQLWLEPPPGWSNLGGCTRADRGIDWATGPGPGSRFRARSTPAGTTARLAVGTHADVLGVGSRFARVLACQVAGRALQPGESLLLSLSRDPGDGTARIPEVGGSGAVRWLVAPPEVELPDRNPVLAEALPGTPRAQPQPQALQLTVRPGPPRRVLATLPSRAAVGERVTVKVRVLDEYFNLVRRWPAPTRLTANGALAGLAAEVTPDEHGVGRAAAEVSAPGLVRVTVEVAGLPPRTSNPLEVVDDPAAPRIYWGDLHSHTGRSHDGTGAGALDYAAHAAALDFHALTEHARHLTPAEWAAVQETVVAARRPGEFVTLLAFEDSAFQPSGHFNLYFGADRAPLRVPGGLGEVPEMYGQPLDPLVIQHHTGMQWEVDLPEIVLDGFNAVLGPQVHWDADPEVRRHAVEIYSLHGSSERYDPEDALAYRQVDMTLREGAAEGGRCPTGHALDGPHYARDGWAAGHLMGTVAGSDDHRAQPGRRGGGLTAVLADGLTREAVLAAIRERRTYATTGDRIILDLRLGGQSMGSVLEPAPRRSLVIVAAGTAPIERLTLWRLARGSVRWEAAVDLRPGTPEVRHAQELPTAEPAVYYLALEQAGLANGRPVRAWSSPIWVGRPALAGAGGS